MAVTTLTANAVPLNSMSADLPVTGGTAINPANTMEVAFPQEGKLLLVVNNTTAGAKKVTVEAGATEFIASVQGSLELSLAQDDVRYIMVTSDRFKQSSGVLSLAFESGMTGFVFALALPNA